MELSTVEAKDAYAVLVEREQEGEYLALMWLAQVSQRWAQGEELEDVMELVINSARSFWGKASGALYPTAPQEETCLALFEAVGEDPPDVVRVIGHGGLE